MLTQSCRTSRELWLEILRRSCREEKLFLVSTKKELDDIQKIMVANIDEVLQRDSLCGKRSQCW